MAKYPNLQEVLNEATTMEELYKNYIEILRLEKTLQCNLYANKLEELMKMLQPAYIRGLESEFHGLKSIVSTISKENGTPITLKTRKKDFIGLNKKIRLYIEKGEPLDRLRDFLGFRLILLTGRDDTMESVSLCYKVLNALINFFVTDRGCLPLEASPIWDTGFKQEEHPEIIVPKESLILEGFKDNVKDYIITPKKNGYQSLHLVIKKPNGLTFEIQVRTQAMDIKAEYGTATHIMHKNNRYKDIELGLDLSNVSMPGFAIVKVKEPDGKERIEIYDENGLCKAIDPFNKL